MALTEQELQEMAALAGELGDEEAELGAREALNAMTSQTSQGPIDTLVGGANIIAKGVAGAGEQVIGGLSALGGVLSGRDLGQSVSNAEALTQSIPDVPLGQQGQQLVKAISEKFQASPRMVQDIVNAAITLGPTLGESTFKATGSPLLASAAETLPTALSSATGLAGARQAATSGLSLPTGARTGAETGLTVSQAAEGIFNYQSPTKQRIARLIKEGSTDVETARFQLAPPGTTPPPAQPTGLQQFLNIGGPKVRADAQATETIKQGFDEGVIAAIKGANPTDKKKMLDMVNIMERGKKNKRFAVTNRPSDVAGDSLLNRFRIVKSANRRAGQELDGVASGLKGQRADFNPAISQFIDDLDSIGVNIGNDVKPRFKNSDIEGVKPAERIITQLVDRMKFTKTPDAHDMHRLKRFIDEQVTFGKNSEGLAGRTESIMKNLRRNLDQTLDDTFPEYNRVNTTYAETIGAIDSLQDVAGKKMNLTGPNADKATGTLLRRLMSNAQSRVRLLDSVNDLEAVAKKHSGTGTDIVPFGSPGGKATKLEKIDDDLLTQVLFVDELDAVFGPVARTSFQGQIDQALKQGVRATTTRAGALDTALDVAGKTAEKVRGIDEDGAFKSIKNLLKR